MPRLYTPIRQMDHRLTVRDRKGVRRAIRGAFGALLLFFIVPPAAAIGLALAKGRLPMFVGRHFVSGIMLVLIVYFSCALVFVVEMFRVRCPACRCRLLESRRGESAARLVFRDAEGRPISRMHNLITALTRRHIVCLRCGADLDLSI